MALDFYLDPADVRAYQADAWAAPHLKALADDWEQQALAKLNAPTQPDPGLAAHLGGAAPQESPQTAPTDAITPQVAPTVPIAPEPVPAAPTEAIAPTLPAPDASLPTDYGPVPKSPQRQPISTAPSAPAPSPSPFGDLVNYARQAAQKVGIDPDLFTRQINQESNFNPAARSPAGAQGIAQIVPRWHPGVDVTDPYASLDYAANLMSSLIKQHGGDVRTALVAYNGGQGAVDALNAGTPYAESKEYVNRIMSGGAPAPSAASAAPAGNLSLSQFGDKTLTADEAYAACGPAAAARLASEYGNAIPLSVALQAAKQVGWTPGGGMNGIANEKKLMDALGLPAELDTSRDWGKITSGIGAGKLVTISTGGGNVPVQYGHYFSANGARQRPDGQIELYVGQSGKDLKAGKEWMTPAEIEAVAGPINGALFSDPSRAVMAGDWHQKVINREGLPPPTPDEAMADLTQAAQKVGVRRPDETISNPFGEAFRQMGNVAGQVGDALGGIGRAKDRAIYGPSGHPLTQEEVNANWQRGSEALGGAQVTVPANPLDVLGGSGLGVPTGGEQMTAERDRWIAENNPLRDVPVVGGATTMAAQAITDPTNLLLAGPGIGKAAGAVAREAGPALEAAGPAVRGFLRNESGELRFPGGQVGPRLPEDQAMTLYDNLGQQWEQLDHAAADLEARSAAAFNPGLKARLANEAARTRAEQERVQAMADHLVEHGNLPPETSTALPESGPVFRPEPEPATTTTVTAPSPQAVNQTAILSSPNYRRLQAMRGTPEQQAALRDPETGFAGNINLDKITPDSVKQALQRTMDSSSTAEFAGQRRGVITDSEAMQNAAAKALTMAPQDWIKTKPGRVFNQEEAIALGNQMIRTGNEYDTMRAALAAREAAGDATDLERAAVADKSLEFALLEGVRSGAAAEAGRALRSFRQVLDGALQSKNGDTSKALRAALKTIGGEDAYAEWAQKWAALDPADTVGKYRMLQALHKPSRMQQLVAWTTSNMLSGTKTLEVNLVGGATETLNRPLITLLGGRPVDAWTDLTAMGRAVGQAWGNAGTTLSTGVRPSRAAQTLADPTKYDSVRAEAFSGKSGLVMTPALRVMSATDEFLRTMNAAGALAVAARREARTTGKTVQEILSQPPDHVLAYAQKAADAAVFEGPGSPASKMIGSWRNLINSNSLPERLTGVAGHVLFPFVHIPEQILIRGTKMLPVVNEVSTIMDLRKAMQAGDSQTARDAAARYVLTTGVLLAAGSQALAGNITGIGPKDTAKRAALDDARDANGNKVWQAHSVRMGDRWVDYTNLGPVSIPLAVLSNAYEAYMDSGKKPGANEVAEVFNKVASTMLDASYIKSFGDLMKGISEGNMVKTGGSLANNLATRFVPFGGAFAQAERLTDQEVKDPKNPLQYVASRVPIASEFVPDKPSPFGGARQSPQDLLATISPFRTSAPGLPEPVSSAFVGVGMGAPGAPPTIRVTSKMTGSLSPPITLNEQEKTRYVQLLGERLSERLAPITSDPGWMRRTPEARKQVLERQLKLARDYVEAQLYNSMEQGDRTQRMNEGRRSLVPTATR